MHQINVLAFGSKNFNTSLTELEDHLNFKLTTVDKNIDIKLFENYKEKFPESPFKAFAERKLTELKEEKHMKSD